jgi:soluble lytic murein transglycosylase-like protein
MRPDPTARGGRLRRAGWWIALIVLSNIASHLLWQPESWLAVADERATPVSLYLLEEAALHIADTACFARGVRQVAGSLEIPPEWLMAVIYAESRFDAAVRNHRGSGATGLIQFMPATARELQTSTQHLRALPPCMQLEYVYRYLQQVKSRYGPFRSLTDLYLGILYPRARGQDLCYTLYSRPAKAYLQNRGLDENGDGRVTVSDIDRRLQRIFPTAYAIAK